MSPAVSDENGSSKTVLWVVVILAVLLPCLAIGGLVAAGALTSLFYVRDARPAPIAAPVTVGPVVAPAPPTEVRITVAIDATGAISIDGRALTEDGLRAEARAAAARGHVTAVLAADRGVEYARVIAVMDLLRTEGVTDVAFATAPL